MAEHARDLQLARRVLAGDRDAFDGFFRQHFPRLYRFVLLRVERDADAAQDLCQQVLERAIRRLAAFRGEASLLTWLCQIARHEIADYWEHCARDRHRHLSYDQDDLLRHALESLEVEASAAPEALREQSDLHLLVQSVLDHLPGRYGDALEWKYVEGLAGEEIAARLGLTAEAAHSMLARARRAFRVEFQAVVQELGYER